MNNKIKYTPQGFSYIDVTLDECLNWGGFGICNGCNKIYENLKLIYVLQDTYCKNCFNNWLERTKKYPKEDIEEDLIIQNQFHLTWYKAHGVINNDRHY